MDLMNLRRELLAMAQKDGLPKYLGHIMFKPDSDTMSHAFDIGEGCHNAVLISDCPTTTPTKILAMNAFINFETNGEFWSNTSRMAVRMTSGVVDYYGKTSSGQSWSYTNGILTLSNSRWYFGAGITYDLFYW